MTMEISTFYFAPDFGRGTFSIAAFGIICLWANIGSLYGQTQSAGVEIKPANYQLVWSDEFDQEGPPNPEFWTFEKGFVRNQELQYYKAENAVCQNGVLKITALRETVSNPRFEKKSNSWKRNREKANYTSASLNTSKSKSWKYGYFEIKARITAKAGLWPAIWTLGKTRSWPSCGEIDVMEFYDNSILANAGYSNPRKRGIKWDSTKTPLAEMGGVDWADKWHVWKLLWTKDQIKIFVDEQLLNTVDVEAATDSSGFNPFRQPHYLLLNLAIGGTRGGNPDKTDFPAFYLIDYVRIYQSNQIE